MRNLFLEGGSVRSSAYFAFHFSAPHREDQCAGKPRTEPCKATFRRAAFRILPALTNARNPCPRFYVPCLPDTQNRHDAEDEKETRSLRLVLRKTESSTLALILPRSFEKLIVRIRRTSTSRHSSTVVDRRYRRKVREQPPSRKRLRRRARTASCAP